MFFFFFNDEKINALTLANYILQKAAVSGITVTNMKLQKILYYVQGHYLAHFYHPLFPEEIHAWKFGPVVPDVYYEFSYFGPAPLRMSEAPDMSACSNEELKLIDWVIDTKLKLTASELMRATHSEAPWLNATDNGMNIRRNQVISVKAMQEYFST